MGRELGVTGLPSEKVRKGFELFLKALVADRVDSETDFSETVSKFIDTSKRINIDFESMMHACALWMKSCVAGGNKKWMKNDDMSGFDKKGFDIFYKYAPKKIRDILKSGGQPLLNIFSDEYAKETNASFSDLNPEVVEFYNNNSEELENEWQFKIDNMEDSDIEHKRKLRNSEIAFFEFVEDKYFEQKTQSSSDYSLNNIPYLRKASIKEVLNSPEFLTEENVLKLLPDIESYSDVLDSRYTFLTPVPRYFIMQVDDKEILVNTEGYDYPRYMIRIESNKSQASKVVDGFVVQLESGLYFQKEIKRSILTTTDLDKAELYPLEINANNHMDRLGIKNYKLVKHSKDKTTSSVQAFNSVIASTDFYPSEDLSFDDLYSKLIEDGYNVKNKSSVSYIVGDINSNSVVWVFKNGNSILLTRYAGNNPKFLIDYIYNKFEIIMEDEDIVEASSKLGMSFDEVSNLKYKNKCIRETFGPSVGTRTVCRDICELDYPYFAVKREIKNEVTYEIREYTDFGSKLVEIIDPPKAEANSLQQSSAHLKKETVHNQLEAETLIKEAFSRGEEEKYNETEFFTHDGKKLFKCLIDTVDYEMVYPDGSSTKVDVL